MKNRAIYRLERCSPSGLFSYRIYDTLTDAVAAYNAANGERRIIKMIAPTNETSLYSDSKVIMECPG